MIKLRYFLMCLIGISMVMSVTSCQRRGARGAGTGADGVSPIRGMPGDSIYGEGLGSRAGFDGEFIEGQFEAVLFAFDSSQIQESERHKLEDVARHLRRNPNAVVIIEGHTDERGSREYNLSLGERRALASRAYLVGLGIDGNRIQTSSYGPERPAASGHNEEAWRQNRRTEFLVSQ